MRSGHVTSSVSSECVMNGAVGKNKWGADWGQGLEISWVELIQINRGGWASIQDVLSVPNVKYGCRYVWVEELDMTLKKMHGPDAVPSLTQQDSLAEPGWSALVSQEKTQVGGHCYRYMVQYGRETDGSCPVDRGLSEEVKLARSGQRWVT